MRRRAGIHSIFGRITGYGYAETAPIRRLAAALLFAEDPPVELSESGSLSGWSGLWASDVPLRSKATQWPHCPSGLLLGHNPRPINYHSAKPMLKGSSPKNCANH
jgi:hypothetical protein